MRSSQMPYAHQSNGGYNPYPSKPPKTKIISPQKKNVQFSESFVMNRSFNTGSPEKIEMKKKFTTKRYKKKSLRQKRDKAYKINKPSLEIDYSEAYRNPDHYFVRNSKFGKVYCCPEPKVNLTHINQDLTLGGAKYRPRIPSAPFFSFNDSFNQTPVSTLYCRIIPWDDVEKDYVYGAIQDACFRGFYDRRTLKNKIDYEITHDRIHGNDCYNICFYLSVSLVVLTLVCWVITLPLYWNEFKNSTFWYFAALFAPIIVIIVFFFICRNGSKSKIKKRFQSISKACESVNERHLKGTGVSVYPGDQAAWIEVLMDERRTVVRGDPIEDTLSYNLIKDDTRREILKIQKENNIIKKENLDVIEEESYLSSPEKMKKPVLIEEVEYQSNGGDVNDVSFNNNTSKYLNKKLNEIPKEQFIQRNQRDKLTGNEYHIDLEGYERIENESRYESNYSKGTPQKNLMKYSPKFKNYEEKENLGNFENTSGVSKSHLEFYERLKKTKEDQRKQANPDNVFKKQSFGNWENRDILGEVSSGRKWQQKKTTIFENKKIRNEYEDEEVQNILRVNYDSELPVIMENQHNVSIEKIPGIGMNLIGE